MSRLIIATEMCSLMLLFTVATAIVWTFRSEIRCKLSDASICDLSQLTCARYDRGSGPMTPQEIADMITNELKQPY